jgi:phosphate uptake regulator
MKRKVIQLAKNTLVVSLPAKWAKTHSIKKGDEVEIEEADKILKICSLSVKDEGKVTVRYQKKYFLKRVIATPYRMGYNEIRIEYDNPELYYKIQSEINNLIGFEIIKQGDGYCIAKNIAQGIEAEFEASVNRLFLVTINFLEDISDNFDKGDYEKLKIIKNSEDLTNKLAHFCKRMLNKDKIPNNIRSKSIYRIVCLTEEIGDIGKKICEYIIKNNIKISEGNKDYLKKIIEQIKMLYAFYKKFKHEDLKKYAELEKTNEKQCFELIKKLNKENYITFCISMIVENIKHLSEEVFE